MSRDVLRVLTYHRVVDADPSVLPDPSISATPAVFERQLRYLLKHHCVVSAADVLSALRGERALPARAVLLTFDDGYRDFGDVAWPILRRHRLPVTLFVPTAYPDRPDLHFWWDRLHAALAHTPASVLAHTPLGRLRLDTPEQRRAALRALRRVLRTLPPSDVLRWIDQIAVDLGSVTGLTPAVLSWDELRALQQQGVTLGAHTRTHAALDQLPIERAVEEIDGSRTDLERETGRTPALFAYPFGAHTDAVVSAVKHAGFALAVTCEDGYNPIRRRDPLRLRRTNITMRTSPAMLRLRLTRPGAWLDALRHGRIGVGRPLTAALSVLALLMCVAATVSRSGSPAAPPDAAPVDGVWIGSDEIRARPMSGPAWASLKAQADRPCAVPDLSDQDQSSNVCVLARALVFARSGESRYRDDVSAAIGSIVSSGPYRGRALALGRELAAYIIAADLIRLADHDPGLDARFRAKLRALLTVPTRDGPAHLVECHEKRPNNWGTHCGASRVAAAAYLKDHAELARAAQVFRGWLGDRSAYAEFDFGDDLTWQCRAHAPVAVNPRGCAKAGRSIDGVLPDDQRRGGSFSWPPPRENYVYEALQGAIVQAGILSRHGYDVWNWEDRALLRAFTWLHAQAGFPATGDDGWQPHVINHAYGTSFPAPIPSRPGKNMGWTDWTHR